MPRAVSFDPYRLLGLTRAATAAAVKAAYRASVQSAHPDRGGDPEAFIAIVKAFGILSDPEARRLYDETGIVDEQAVAAYRREVGAILVDMFDAAVASAVASGLKLERVDFIAQMTHAVRTGIAGAKAEAARAEREIAALSGLKDRITRRSEGTNLLAERLAAQVADKEQQRTTVRRRLMILDTAIVELGNYSSEVELIAALETAEG
jgi:curved DNA-binding protein CbpA